ncbi:Apc15p protein-domain-containing protein [Biscogniauxia sp. FL1348]|nr:Apc15p protein-domain-containing protein [Biscogniauxia sp. FL1348]
MLSLLPDLTPRDSHSLWYTSSRNPLASSSFHDATQLPNHPYDSSSSSPGGGSGGGGPLAALGGVNSHHHQHRRGAHLIERSPLARLRADEQNLDRRRQNIVNFGSAWLKPPGVPKTLHQLREERREAEEHQEALRREQLALELAEAEAAGVGAAAGDVDALLDAHEGGGEDGMDDVQLDGARDLDDDIPEADADFGLDGDEDEEDEEDEEESDEDEDEEAENEDREQRAARTQQQLMAQRMRQADDAFRENVARGRDSAGFGADEEVDEEDQAQMIEEEDLVGHGDGGDMGMDADLDDEIPEAASAGYEHTDTEADLSSEDEDDHGDMSFAAQAPHASRFRASLARSDVTRNSIAISDILSRDGSSFLDSSPQLQRRVSGHGRRGRG